MKFPFRRTVWILVPLTTFLACGDRTEQEPEPDPFVSVEPPPKTLTEFDYGELDPDEIGINLPWARNIVSRDVTPDMAVARVTGVSVEQSAGFDRVVFSVEPHMPGYRLTLVEEAAGGCGEPEADPVAGRHLVVELESAEADEAVAAAGDGSLGFPALVSAVQTCNEGDHVRWLLGLSDDVEFRIMEAGGNVRLVVDVRHPAPA